MCEKNRHANWLIKHIANFGSKQELAVHRASLADQLEDCIAANKWYVNAPDFNAEEDENPDEWIKRFEVITM
jgi:hypothetical protein